MVDRSQWFAKLAGCGPGPSSSPTSSPTATPPPPAVGAGSFRLPFPSGTMVSTGSYGLHPGNFGSVPGLTFDGAGTVKASLDLLVAASTEVHPVAAGTVGRWSRPRRPGPGEQFAADRIELSDVAPAEALIQRWQELHG